MCLAVPMKLVSVSPDRATGEVAVGADTLVVGLDLVAGVAPGDYVLVHAGMAIESLEDEDAAAILESIEEYVETMDRVSPE